MAVVRRAMYHPVRTAHTGGPVSLLLLDIVEHVKQRL
ncbi:MAG: hypothetical protein AVDCRST_MAG93-5877, partial [uncultured Chloroflexia bacterium]